MTDSRPKRAGPPGVRPPAGKRSDSFDPGCTRCPRLAEYLAETHERYPDYWARPVPSFGPPDAKLCFVGLAPGMHGRTGQVGPSLVTMRGFFSTRLCMSSGWRLPASPFRWTMV